MSVLPSSPSSKNANKLPETLALLPQPPPDLILIQETKHIKISSGCVHEEKTQKHVEAIAELLEPDYEFHAVSHQLAPDADASFCHGTGFFVRRAGLLHSGGRLVQPPWDHDGHVSYWEAPLGRVVLCYLPTPTKKERRNGPPQHVIRQQYDNQLRALLEELTGLQAQPRLLAVMGDMNVTLDRDLDTTNPFDGPQYLACVSRLKETMAAAELQDVWRERHGSERRYSSYQQQHGTQARVDLALVPRHRPVVSVELMDADGDWTHSGKTRSHRSDHVPLLLRLQMDEALPPPPPGNAMLPASPTSSQRNGKRPYHSR